MRLSLFTKRLFSCHYRFCEHIFDRIGCAFNAPAAYADNVFETCQGENQDFPGTSHYSFRPEPRLTRTHRYLHLERCRPDLHPTPRVARPDHRPPIRAPYPRILRMHPIHQLVDLHRRTHGQHLYPFYLLHLDSHQHVDDACDDDSSYYGDLVYPECGCCWCRRRPPGRPCWLCRPRVCALSFLGTRGLLKTYLLHSFALKNIHVYSNLVRLKMICLLLMSPPTLA